MKWTTLFHLSWGRKCEDQAHGNYTQDAVVTTTTTTTTTTAAAATTTTVAGDVLISVLFHIHKFWFNSSRERTDLGSRRSWEDNIKMVRGKSVLAYWTGSRRIIWWAWVLTVMNIRVPKFCILKCLYIFRMQRENKRSTFRFFIVIFGD